MKLRDFDILVVDDDELLLRAIEGFLSDEGATVTTSNNGLAAFDLINEHNFDCIISDICMPEMSGLELLDKVRQELHDKTHFILASGYPDFSDEEVKSRGARALIQKPINFILLSGLIIELC